MGSRLGFRLLLILVVTLAAIQVAFRPVTLVGRAPSFGRPGIHMNLGLDLKGGSLLVLEGQDTPDVKATPERVDAAMSVIERRIDQLGVVEPTVQRQGSKRIIVELPGIGDPDRAIRLIGKTALLEFVDTAVQQLLEGATWSPDGKTVTLPQPPGSLQPQPQPAPARTIQLTKKVIVTGADLEDARATFDQQTAQPVVSFQFRGKGAKVFEDHTGANIGKYLTIVLDNEVISSPVIQARITGGQGQISGRFTLEEARDLAVLLRGGSLPIPVEVVEKRAVGPQLGRDSIDASIKAGWIATTAVLAFMLLYFGFLGLLADLALGVYLVVMVALLTALDATLTLPGIAGIILSIGMAVDANVIIFERVKEELRAGKSLRAAIGAGWNRAMSAILDSNVTTLLAGAVLFMLGSGPIRGFAVTLSIGVAVSMFSAIAVTRALVDGAAAAGLGSQVARVAGRSGS